MANPDKKPGGYTLSRQWFDFAFENPELCTTMQCALYMWLIECNNRKGFVEKFPFNTEDAINATGCKNRKTVWKALNELIDLGFVTMVFKSGHRHIPTIISIINNKIKSNGCLDISLKTGNEIGNITYPNNGQVSGQVSTLVNGQVSGSVNGQVSGQVSGHSLNYQTSNLKPLTYVYTAPLWNDVLNFFTEKKYSEPEAKKVFDYYERLKNENGEWTDKNGYVVENWQNKIISVWMTGEPILKQNNFNQNGTGQNQRTNKRNGDTPPKNGYVKP